MIKYSTAGSGKASQKESPVVLGKIWLVLGFGWFVGIKKPLCGLGIRVFCGVVVALILIYKCNQLVYYTLVICVYLFAFTAQGFFGMKELL